MESLHPLEVRHDHAAGVGEDVGDDGDAAVAQDHVGLRRRRAVGALGDDGGLDAVGVVLAELRSDRRRNQDVARLLEDLRVRDGLGVGEPADAAGGGDVGLELSDVESFRVPDAALDVADPDDDAALAPEEPCRNAADVAEPLDDDFLVAELMAEDPRRLIEGVHDPASGERAARRGCAWHDTAR